MVTSCAALGLASVLKPLPLLVWNASASVPVGLYAVSSGTPPKVRDLVLVRLPEDARRLASGRRYLPFDTPAIKRVVAADGDLVCTVNRAIYINGRRRVDALRRDSQGRVLRPWKGCSRLTGDQIFLLNDAPASFDGRYFGPSSRTDVIGVLTPLWTF
ncbi:MAG: S26 family signal peptidase [Alphaproteobacteria bacterium]|nr:S26 family signal peptidase [Alphaproteobacteria bacterium]